MAKAARDKAELLRRALSRGDLADAQKILSTQNRSVKAATPPRRRLRRRTEEPAFTTDLSRRLFPCPEGERALQVASPAIEAFGAEAEATKREYLAVLRGARQRLDELEASPALCHAADASPGDLVLIATRSRGDDQERIALVGILRVEGRQLRLEQYLAEESDSEAAALQVLGTRLESASVVATFARGPCAWKHVQARAEACGVDLFAEGWEVPAGRVRAGRLIHLDLQAECRRRWPGRVRRPRLETVEARVLGFRRSGRTPRADVSRTFGEFLSSADPSHRMEALRHNALDLLTMARIVCLLLTGCEGPLD
jgi:RNase H-like protein